MRTHRFKGVGQQEREACRCDTIGMHPVCVSNRACLTSSAMVSPCIQACVRCHLRSEISGVSDAVLDFSSRDLAADEAASEAASESML